MKYWKKIRKSLLILSVMVMAIGQTVFAADLEEYYTYYTVRLFAGEAEVGMLTGNGVTVYSSTAGISVSNSNMIEITGLRYGDSVYIHANEAAKPVDEAYYVRGVSYAGRETEDEAETAGTENRGGSFEVKGDRDFVINYGVSGEMVPYTVNYLDAAGNALLASDTYYGNVGERQYVSARYVDGYVPQAYNLVKTLASNTAENVFNFQYTPGVTPAAPETPAAPDAGTAAATPGTGAGTAAVPADAGAAVVAPPETEEVIPVEDEDVPEDLVDLDDEDTPLANQKLDGDRPGTKVGYLPVYVGIGAAAAAALLLAAIYLKKHRRAAVTTEELLEEISEDLHDNE